MLSSPSRAGDGRASGAAVATICVGIFCLATNDAMAKWLTAYYPPLQILFLRNLLALPVIILLIVTLVGREALRTRHLKLHALRGLLLVGGGFSFFLALSSLPLAEATALVFSAPILVTALSVPLLGERVGWRRWLAVILGFLGVVVIVQPGAAAFQPASLLALATAFVYALIMISARWIDPEEGIWTLMIYVVLFQLLFSTPALVTGWQAVEATHWRYFLGMALFGTLGMTLISQAFRMAPAAVVAPFDYTALVWASVLGWLVWREIPADTTFLGAGIIVASGIYIVWREARVKPANRTSL